MSQFQHAIYRLDGGPAIDVKRAFEALAPHLPGQWFIVTLAPGLHPAWLQLARLEDNLRLYLTWAPRNADRTSIQVSVGPYRTGTDDYVDIARLARKAGLKRPMGRMDLARNNPEAVAKDIIRRLITPGETLLPAIIAEIERHQQSEAQRRKTLDLLATFGANVTGTEIRKAATVYVGDLTMRVDLDGSVVVQPFKLPADRVAAFLTFMSSVRTNAEQRAD